MSEYNKILNRDSSVSNLDSKDYPDDLDSISLSNQDNQGRNHDNQGRKSSNQENPLKIKVQTFKQTELGLIPEDWEISKIDSKIDMLTGFPFPSNKYSSSGIRLLRGSNIKRGNTDWSQDITQYWENISPEIKKYELKENDIVIAMDGSLVGRSFAQLKTTDLPALLLQRVARIRSEKVDINYLKEYVCSIYFTEHCDKVKTSSAIPHISPKDIRDFVIPFPPTKKEQKAIAQVLSDTDSLIQTLEQKLVKKRAIKQGAMQQLLTPPSTRSGQATEDWEVRKLGEIGRTFGGLSGKSKPDFSNGNSKYIPFMNIMSNPVIDTTYLYSVFIKKNESQNKAIKGDLFFNGSSETPEEVGLSSVLLENIPNLYLNSFCFGFRLFNQEEFNGLYLSYFFRSDEGRKLFYSLAQGATRYNLSKANFLKLEFPIPNPREQTRIATILSDMDAEIAQLEQKLDKYKLLKQGLMQELLTGRIRLI